MVMRTYGLSGSGLDIDQMVKDLMKARRVSYDKLWQKKTQLEYKKADYNTMYTALQDFRNNTVFNYKLQSTLMPKKVSSTVESTVAAAANADAANVTHDISVTQLAEGARLTSAGSISLPSAPKDSLSTQFGLAADTYEITIKNGTESATIQVDTSKSIYEFVSSINNAGIGIKANYDANLDRFFLYTTGSGANVGIDFSDTADPDGLDFINNTLKLETTSTGKDAQFNLDGINLAQAANTFTVSGVTYNLKALGSARIVVSSDNDQAVAAVKSFISSYNALLEKINGELKEEKYSDYLPLTSDQKNEMKDSEITAWETKAKSGMLRHDSILQDALLKIRSDISTPISGLTGNYNSLSSIGVTTGNYAEGGKLYLDETKLKKALEEDPDIISKLFNTSGDTRAQQGVAVRLYDTLKTSLDKIVTVGGYSSTVDDDTSSSLAKQIKRYETDLDKLNDRLQDIEDRYYKQFDAMETALNRINQQSSWLLQQFSGSSS